VLRLVGDGTGRSLVRCDVVSAPERLAVAAPDANILAVVGGAWESAVDVDMRVAVEELSGGDVLVRDDGTHMVAVDLSGGGGALVPVAAAEAMTGRELNGGMADADRYGALVTVNSAAAWYTGTDGAVPPGRYDLATVLVHEVYRALMFAGGTVAGGGGGGVARFDALLADEAPRHAHIHTFASPQLSSTRPTQPQSAFEWNRTASRPGYLRQFQR
jgi:hypothetical protein